MPRKQSQACAARSYGPKGRLTEAARQHWRKAVRLRQGAASLHAIAHLPPGAPRPPPLAEHGGELQKTAVGTPPTPPTDVTQEVPSVASAHTSHSIEHAGNPNPKSAKPSPLQTARPPDGPKRPRKCISPMLARNNLSVEHCPYKPHTRQQPMFGDLIYFKRGGDGLRTSCKLLLPL